MVALSSGRGGVLLPLQESREGAVIERKCLPQCGTPVLGGPAVHEWGVSCVREGEGDPLDRLQVSKPRVGCKGDADSLTMWHVFCDGALSQPFSFGQAVFHPMLKPGPLGNAPAIEPSPGRNREFGRTIGKRRTLRGLLELSVETTWLEHREVGTVERGSDASSRLP